MGPSPFVCSDVARSSCTYPASGSWFSATSCYLFRAFITTQTRLFSTLCPAQVHPPTFPMFDDLVELATTAVHPSHNPHISYPISNASGSSNMPPRQRREKSQSADANGMPPPAAPASKSPSPVATRHKRTRSTNNQPGSPRQLAQALTTRPHQTAEEIAPGKFLIAVVINLALSTLLRRAAVAYTPVGRGALSTISKNNPTESEAFGLLAWRIAVLAVYWFGGYDGMFAHSVYRLTHN